MEGRGSRGSVRRNPGWEGEVGKMRRTREGGELNDLIDALLGYETLFFRYGVSNLTNFFNQIRSWQPC